MKIAISGYYGFENSGDEAILEAIIQELKKFGHQPLVLSNNPEETSNKYSVKAFHRMKPMSIWQAINYCDAFLSGGGGLLQDKTSKKNLIYYLFLIRLAVFLGKKTFIFNQSIGPLSKTGEKWVSKLLKHPKIKIIVRDKNSQDYLRNLGLNAELGADPALLLPTSAKIESNSVIIAPRAGYPEVTNKLVDLAKNLNAKSYQITVLGLHKNIDKEELQKFSDIPSINIVESADAFGCLSVIQTAKLVIGVRLHALILAAAANKPFIGLSYDPKVLGFCQDAGSPCFDLGFLVDDLVKTVEEIRPLNQNLIEKMKERAKNSFKRII